jgi:hypothetical protein
MRSAYFEFLHNFCFSVSAKINGLKRKVHEGEAAKHAKKLTLSHDRNMPPL